MCGGTPGGARSWSSAQGSCANGGLGCLATINDQAEQDCITAQTSPVYPDNVWFGFHQSMMGSEPAGGWSWQCGTSSYVYPAWGQFEPNNQGGNEDCGVLATGGGWNDADCALDERYVCELP